MRRMLHRLFLRLRPIGAIQLYRVERWYAGYDPASLCCQCGTRTPSFPFLEKEKKGEKRKSLNPQTRKKRTRQIKGVLSNRDSARV